MNAKLITDLEIIRDKLFGMLKHVTNPTARYEIQNAKANVERAIEWETNGEVEIK